MYWHIRYSLCRRRKRNWLALQLHMKQGEADKLGAAQETQDRIQRKLSRYRDKYLFNKNNRPTPWCEFCWLVCLVWYLYWNVCFMLTHIENKIYLYIYVYAYVCVQFSSFRFVKNSFTQAFSLEWPGMCQLFLIDSCVLFDLHALCGGWIASKCSSFHSISIWHTLFTSQTTVFTILWVMLQGVIRLVAMFAFRQPCK